MGDTVMLTAQDAGRQKRVRVRNVAKDSTIGELARDLEFHLEVPVVDSSGRGLTYQVRREREGKQLNSEDRVSDVLEADDCVTLQPNINAG